MADVFISYRREDCAGHAGRLFDRLVGRFGEDSVFMDVDGIEPGADFANRIEEAVESCHLLIALIGREWLDDPDGGPRRLDDPGDFVRREIAAALRRPGLLVIPVLVEGAKMPPAGALPEELRPLARRQALELSDARWGYDVDRLIDVAQRAAEARTDVGSVPDGGVPSRRLTWPRASRRGVLIGLALLVAGVATAVALVGGRGGGEHGPTETIVGPLKLGGLPGRPAVAGGAVWVPLPQRETVRRVDLATRTSADVRDYAGIYPTAVAADSRRVWIADAASDAVQEVDAASRRVINTHKVGDEPADILLAYGYVWTANCACQSGGRGSVSRIDPATGAVIKQIVVGLYPHGLGAGDGFIWVATEEGVRRVDPRTAKARGPLILVGDYPTDVVVDRNGIWVSVYRERRVARIDPRTYENDAVGSVPVGVRPWSLAAGGGFVWVAHQGDGSLRRIDTRARTAGAPLFKRATVPEAEDPTGDGVAYGDGRAWLASRRAGGTLSGVRP